MSAFIGNWRGNAAVIVKVPNPAKSYTLERATQINNKMDVQLGSCSERARTLRYIASRFFKQSDDFHWIFPLPTKFEEFEMTGDHYFSNKIGNDWINGRSPDPNMLLIHVSPFESEFTLNGTDWYTNVTMYGHVIVAINGTEKSFAFDTETQSHQSIDLSQIFGTPNGSAAGSQQGAVAAAIGTLVRK